MTQQSLLKRQKLAEDRFNEISKQITNLQLEQNKLQGEYRLLSSLIEEEKELQAKKEKK